MNSCKNFLLRIFIHLFQKKRALPSIGKARFLIVSTTALGDTLWATPAVRALKKSYPESYISVLTNSTGYALLHNLPEIDSIYLLPKNLVLSFFSLLRSLRKERFDIVLLFHASQRLVFPLSALLNANQIIGTVGQNKGLDDLLTFAIPWKNSHEIERRLDIVYQVGAKKDSYALSYIVKKDEEDIAQEYIRGLHLDPGRPLIALHPGAKDRYKCWHKDKFIELGQLLTKVPLSLLITGTPEERDLIMAISSQIPEAKIITKPLPLRNFAALLQKMDLLITNDTGPLHLAIALETPAIGLYAPTDPKICGPYHAKYASIIAKPRTCTPCLRRKCRYPFCLLQITPQEVFDEAIKILSKKE